MNLDQYLIDNSSQTVMISLTIHDKSTQYNYWNWIGDHDQLHLLNNDMSLGHIIHNGSVNQNDDGSISYSSNYYPKKAILNFYFGGSIQ